MILIFDLDDTLYPERTFVESGLWAVAQFGHERFGWEPKASYHFMITELDRRGRGAIFDRWLSSHGKYSQRMVRTSVATYRRHKPQLSLYPEAKTLLSRLRNQPLYLVTDGHKGVQQSKIDALGISPLFRKTLITRRYGIRHEKPSPYCFERIREWEGCNWSEMAYIGDNPAKDFVSLNKLGMRTVRVLTGMHRLVAARPGYDAQVSVPNLGYFLRSQLLGAIRF